MLPLDLPGKLNKHYIVTIAFFLVQPLLAFPKVRSAKQQTQEMRELIGAYRFGHERSGVILIG